MLRTFLAITVLCIAQATAAGQFLSGISIIAATQVTPAPAPQPVPSDVCDNCGGTGKLGDGTVSVTCPVCDGTGKKTTSPPPPAAQAVPNAVPVPKDGQLSPRGEWRWSTAAWKWQPVKSYRTVTIPAQGHWETVCGRNGCTRRWVQTAPARTIRVEGTSHDHPHEHRARPAYPSQPLGKRWTFNGGNITASHLSGGHHSHEHFDPAWLRTLSRSQLNALGSDSHNNQDHHREQYIVRTR